MSKSICKQISSLIFFFSVNESENTAQIWTKKCVCSATMRHLGFWQNVSMRNYWLANQSLSVVCVIFFTSWKWELRLEIVYPVHEYAEWCGLRRPSVLCYCNRAIRICTTAILKRQRSTDIFLVCFSPYYPAYFPVGIKTQISSQNILSTLSGSSSHHLFQQRPGGTEKVHASTPHWPSLTIICRSPLLNMNHTSPCLLVSQYTPMRLRDYNLKLPIN